MFEKLRQIEERSHEIARLLADPAVLGQPTEYRRLRKEHAELAAIVERFEAYRSVLNRLAEAQRILADDQDRELRELAQLEVSELTTRQATLEEELRQLLLSFFFNDTATTEIYTLSLHDALPISFGASTRLCRVGGKSEFSTDRITRRSEEHTSELQSRRDLVCRLLLEKKKS